MLHTSTETHLSPVLRLQSAAVSLSGGETCHCNAAGPEQVRSAAGYTPDRGTTLCSDLEKKEQRSVPAESLKHQ